MGVAWRMGMAQPELGRSVGMGIWLALVGMGLGMGLGVGLAVGVLRLSLVWP